MMLAQPLFSAPINTVPVAVSYVTRSAIESVTTSYNFGSLSIGTAAADRFVVVGISSTCDSPSTAGASGVTIGGVAATLLVERADDPPDGITTALYGLSVPSGTAATIVATFASNQQRCAAAVWRMTGAESLTPRYTSSGRSGSPISQDITIAPRGAAIALATWRTTTSGTWGGITREFTGAVGSVNDRQEGGSHETATALNALTLEITASPAIISRVIASFR